VEAVQKKATSEGIADLSERVEFCASGHQESGFCPFNILYLVLQELLDIPVLYLSRYIIKNKALYYTLLQEVRDFENWEEWVLFMLRGVEETSRNTITLIQSIKSQMDHYKQEIRGHHGKIYSQDLLNNLFKHPYSKIEFLENDLLVTRQTAARYLDELAEAGLLKKEKIGRHNFYINEDLFQLFMEQ